MNSGGRGSLRIGIGGDDTSVSMVVRPYVQLLGREPRAWQDLRFFVIPLDNHQNPSDNRIAQRIAEVDTQYRALFFTSQWHTALDGQSILIERMFVPFVPLMFLLY